MISYVSNLLISIRLLTPMFEAFLIITYSLKFWYPFDKNRQSGHHNCVKCGEWFKMNHDTFQGETPKKPYFIRDLRCEKCILSLLLILPPKNR